MSDRLKQILAANCNRVTPRDKRIAQMRLDGKPWREVAAEFDVTMERCKQLIRRAYRRLMEEGKR